MGSAVYVGDTSIECMLAAADNEGVSIESAVETLRRRVNWASVRKLGTPIAAYLELHIEQGPILESEGKDIGVVTHGQGLSWTQVTITGTDSHTGSTPMPMRRDAGLGMARVLEKVNEIALSHAHHAVGAAGHIEVYPNSRNVIPGK